MFFIDTIAPMRILRLAEDVRKAPQKNIYSLGLLLFFVLFGTSGFVFASDSPDVDLAKVSIFLMVLFFLVAVMAALMIRSDGKKLAQRVATELTLVATCVDQKTIDAKLGELAEIFHKKSLEKNELLHRLGRNIELEDDATFRKDLESAQHTFRTAQVNFWGFHKVAEDAGYEVRDRYRKYLTAQVVDPTTSAV